MCAILSRATWTVRAGARRCVHRRRYISGVSAATTAPGPGLDYPKHWEADVLLRDGRTAHLRPISADDETLLVEFYEQVSAESKYLRFFAPMPQAVRA